MAVRPCASSSSTPCPSGLVLAVQKVHRPAGRVSCEAHPRRTDHVVRNKGFACLQVSHCAAPPGAWPQGFTSLNDCLGHLSISVEFRVSPSFSDLGVAPRAVSDLAARGITEPFPIQAATLPDALAGRDVAGKAPTGAGKTLAFGLPLVDRCGPAQPHRPSALVLVPTRELAGQVADELRLLARSHNLRVAAVYGGVGFGPQRKALREGVEILVACPGRLMDLIQQGDVRLDRIQVVVLDEADRMADMGFLPEVKRLLDQMPEDRQTLLFSATLDGDVDVIIKKYQRNPARHEMAGDDGKLPDATHLFWKTSCATTASPRLGRRASSSSAGATIVFCRTRHGAERVAKKLSAQGVEAVAIHGARSQSQREKALRDFTDGQAQAPGRHRRGRPGHPRRQRGRGRPPRPAGRPQGLRPPLGPHRPGRQPGHRRVARGRQRAGRGHQDPEGARPAHRQHHARPVDHPAGPAPRGQGRPLLEAPQRPRPHRAPGPPRRQPPLGDQPPQRPQRPAPGTTGRAPTVSPPARAPGPRRTPRS